MWFALTSRFVFGTLLVSLCMPHLSAAGQSDRLLPQGWQAFENCPVRAEHVVDVPALESGQLAAVEAELNQSVQENAVLARLDQDIAQLSQRLAEFELASASSLATDNSNVDFHQFAMEQREDDLCNSFQKNSVVLRRRLAGARPHT